MLLAAACGTTVPHSVYRAGANRQTAGYMKQVRLGQTEQGTFDVTSMTLVPPMLEPNLEDSWPDVSGKFFKRQVTLCLVTALEHLPMRLSEHIEATLRGQPKWR